MCLVNELCLLVLIVLFNLCYRWCLCVWLLACLALLFGVVFVFVWQMDLLWVLRFAFGELGFV